MSRSINHPDDVFLWPEGTWCYRNELWEMDHMSDDYLILRVDSSAWIRFFEDIENDHREQEEILDANYAI